MATGIIQSSSAVTSIVVVLATSGVLIGGTGDGVYYVVIGSNIGTCVTALLSSIGAQPNARRAAIIHLLFNCFGAVIFTIFLLCWGWSGTSFQSVVLNAIFPENYQFQIAFFHTLFNVTCTILFLPFAKGFVWLANRLVREKKGAAEERADLLSEPDERLLRNPSVGLAYLYQETGKLFTYSMKTLDTAFHAFLAKDMSVTEAVNERNTEIAQMSKQEVSYLVKLSANSLVMEEEKTISSLHYVLNDIVRIGELADNVTKYTGHYVNDGLHFSSEFLEMLKEMYAKIGHLYEVSLDVFTKIDNERRRLVQTHIQRLNEGKCQPQNSSVFINLVGNLERAADHITYIAHSIEQNQ